MAVAAFNCSTSIALYNAHERRFSTKVESEKVRRAAEVFYFFYI